MEHRSPDPDQDAWIKTAAALACDWSGQSIRYDTLAAFTEDMMRHGMLEVVDAK
jgi:glutamine synthetase